MFVFHLRKNDLNHARVSAIAMPQIFIGTTHVGGCDDLMALDRRGEDRKSTRLNSSHG